MIHAAIHGNRKLQPLQIFSQDHNLASHTTNVLCANYEHKDRVYGVQIKTMEHFLVNGLHL